VRQLEELGFQPIYFFFNSKLGTAAGSDPVGLARAFLFQLLDVYPQLVDPLSPMCTKSGSDEATSFDALWEIFCSWCSQQSRPTFCVIDALDESLDGCERPDNFLATIVSALKSCNMLRICVTSRPDPRIIKHFSPTAGNGSSTSQVAISESQISSDIMAYITAGVERFPKLKLWMTQSDIDTLCSRAEGMFLWYVISWIRD
jgi:hypothetical protein